MVLMMTAMILATAFAAAPSASDDLLRNGWYVQDGRAIWGYGQYNGWWGAYRANLTRNAPGEIGPNRTEDLDALADAMLRFGYPGFEHNYGLWYDRRRDRHDMERRADPNAVGPFLEQPWTRSGKGTAWDGKSLYDLAAFNDWYFDRLAAFADLCDRKGTILILSYYMQHALLETEAHYVDFPWRPANCIQETGMPDRIPAANAFYDISHPLRRKLHEAYIRRCLDVLGGRRNVIHIASQQYTGPRSFLEFWLDTVFAWEKETGRDVHVAINGTKDVIDALLADPRRAPGISSIDLRYWWYLPDGALYAPPGGKEVAGRYASGGEVAKTTPEMIYRQVREVRDRYPDKGIIHMINASRQQTWAFLMGGGSLLVRYLEYADKEEKRYVAPAGVEPILPLYGFIREHAGAILPRMKPATIAIPSDTTWCLAAPGEAYLIYTLEVGAILDLSEDRGTFRAQWLDPRTAELSDAGDGITWANEPGEFNLFISPSDDDWALWLTRTDDLRAQALHAMARATKYLTKNVSTGGGYLWSYTPDLRQRWGEGDATATQIWVQPPGTPSVGRAFLDAHEATGDSDYLDAAIAAGRALAWGQLECGGWTYKIDFRDRWPESEPPRPKGSGTFDDNTTQSALSFLIALDKRATDARIRDAVERGLAYLKQAQYPNGAWPQVYPLAGSYHDHYTFNDNAINDCIRVALEAYLAYGRKDCLEMALRGGEFMIASRLPEPQPGWAQQYDHDMKPAPARWFEPAAVNAATTSSNIATLVDLFLESGDEKFLAPIPAAIAWLERSRLPDGQWARFYELKTNRPIYVNLDRKVVYEFVNIRPGYSWMGTYGIASNVERYKRVREIGRDALLHEERERETRARPSEAQVRSVIDALDAEGRWLTKDRIEMDTFVRNLGILVRFVRSQ